MIENRRDGYSFRGQDLPYQSERGRPVEIIGIIVAGVIIGLLGKWVAPSSRDNTPLWLTVLCGVGGVLIGYYVAGALGVAETSGVDWMRWIISVVVAAVLVMVAASLTSRRSGRITSSRM
jgi:uncharacterized membrane protein YeaQ/YmgE (transglycosylase-associated protein family)